MKRTFFVTMVLAMAALTVTAQTNNYAETVNTLIGTDYTGNTYPGAQLPFGMVQLSPDNGTPGWDWIAGYFYPDSTINGFSHTHLSGTGAGDMYDISFMPVTYPVRKADAPLGIHSRFSHSDETAHAGYYQVRLSDYDINVELTATERCGVQRYTFPANGKEKVVILDLARAMNWDATVDTYINIVDSFTIEGYRFSDGWARNQKVWFRTRFSQPFQWVNTDTTALKAGKGLTATFGFGTDTPRQLTVITALSPTGLDGALKNITAEAKTTDFDYFRYQAEKVWNSTLGLIEVTGGTDAQRTTFYTALYHAMIAPTLLGDVDGQYLGADRKIHRAHGWNNYGTFSLWDTYRAAHPLYNILLPAKASDMVNALLAFSAENGRLPVWNMWSSETDMMIGYHAASVIAEAVLKGVANIDAETALAECVKTANLDEYRGIGLYKRLGYVPYDVKEPTLGDDDWSLSRTLEYAYDDACIAALAKSMGKTDIAATFAKRALNYRNVYNPVSTFMQPRDSNGDFQPDYSPDEYTPHICESNGWHYMWSVQHDPEGLIKLLGRKMFAQKLDSLFEYTPKANSKLPLFSTGMIGQYAQGNEPSHHAAYFFNKIGQPEKTQRYIHKILTQLYNEKPAGLCGNEDCGQTSAWYVFNAMGFYPFNPVSCQYEMGTPLFPKVTIHLPGGNTFVIEAANLRPDGYAVKSASLNGKRLKRTYFTHQELMSGGKLLFEMK